MQPDTDNTIPQQPATQPADVRDDLDQANIEKQGQPRDASDAGAEPDSHFGAVEDTSTGESDQALVTPPMTGPGNVTDDAESNEADVDPHDEITGG